MRLRSLDKYIKDKVQGYKPPVEADLWRGIEENLSPARVPNGRGSWMLPVAAAVAIAILAPFTIKFYNITGRSQEIAVKNVEKSGEETVTHIQYKANIKSGNSLSADLSSPNRTSSSSLSPVSPIQSSLHHPVAENNNQGQHLLTASYLKKHSNRNSQRTTGFSGGYSAGTQNQRQGLLNQMGAASVEIASNQKISGKELMAYISPKTSLIESNANENINNKNETRYPDRKDRHPLNNDRWENWQSIYYPFWDNPAYTGSEGKLSVMGNYGSDNISEPNSTEPSRQFTQTNLGAETDFPSIGLGIGAFRLSELSPYYLQNNYGIALSKSVLQIGSTSIKIGASGTVIDKSLFSNMLNYSDQINPVFGFINATNEKNISGTTEAFGVNGGLWLSNPHVVAGLDVTNANQPKLGFSSDAAALPRQWRALLGYRFAISSDWQFMPMAVITREYKVNQANAMFTVVFKNNFMLSFAYQNIDPVSGLGNAYIYGAVNIARKIRLFASYGSDLELMQTGVNENFVQAGLKWQVIR